jgi:hypothetical protein
MKLLLSLSFFMSFATFGQQDLEKCLNEAVEMSVTLKIDQLSRTGCTNIGIEGFRKIEKERQEKRRLYKTALKALTSVGNIPSSLIFSLKENEPDILLNKKSLCQAVQKKSAQAANEIMKDCPQAAELFPYFIKMQQEFDKISEISLAHACPKVQHLKKQACRDSKIVYKADSVKTQVRSSSDVGASAQAQ